MPNPGRHVSASAGPLPARVGVPHPGRHRVRIRGSAAGPCRRDLPDFSTAPRRPLRGGRRSPFRRGALCDFPCRRRRGRRRSRPRTARHRALRGGRGPADPASSGDAKACVDDPRATRYQQQGRERSEHPPAPLEGVKFLSTPLTGARPSSSHERHSSVRICDSGRYRHAGLDAQGKPSRSASCSGCGLEPRTSGRYPILSEPSTWQCGASTNVQREASRCGSVVAGAHAADLGGGVVLTSPCGPGHPDGWDRRCTR